jgi:hypothetical protein
MGRIVSCRSPDPERQILLVVSSGSFTQCMVLFQKRKVSILLLESIKINIVTFFYQTDSETWVLRSRIKQLDLRDIVTLVLCRYVPMLTFVETSINDVPLCAKTWEFNALTHVIFCTTHGRIFRHFWPSEHFPILKLTPGSAMLHMTVEKSPVSLLEIQTPLWFGLYFDSC